MAAASITRKRKQLATPILLLLFAIACLAPLGDQLGNLVQEPVGSFSLLQAIRGTLLLALSGLLYILFIILTVTKPHGLLRHRTGVVLILILFNTMLLIFATKEIVETGFLGHASLIAYLKIVNWLLLWFFVVLFCQDLRSSEFMLLGFVLGALGPALVILATYGLDAGRIIRYEQAGLKASAGFMTSAKFIAGLLVASAVAAAYLGRIRFPWLSAFFGSVLIAAVIITYNRSAQMSLLAALAWLFLWRILFAERTVGRNFALRLLVPSLFVLFAFFFIVGFEGLETRWGDLRNPKQAGSGRLVFYRSALAYYKQAGLGDYLFGIGQHRMLRYMNTRVGTRIHTHSDATDMLLMGGALGVLSWMFFWIVVLSLFRGVPRGSPEFAAMGAIFFAFLAMSTLTGQIEGISAMFTFLGSLTCLSRIAHEKVRQGDYNFANA